LIICELFWLEIASKTSDLTGAYNPFLKILILPSFIYITASAETSHSRNDNQLLSQSGHVIPMALSGAKGGPPGLGI